MYVVSVMAQERQFHLPIVVRKNLSLVCACANKSMTSGWHYTELKKNEGVYQIHKWHSSH